MSRRKLSLANNPLLSGPALQERSRSGVPYLEVDIELIERDPNQPRVNFDENKLNELANSIETYGVMSPLIVKPANKAGKYRLIAGERRLRASRKVGLKSVPVLVNSDDNKSGDTILAMQLVENMQRDDLTPLERAHAIGALKEAHGLSIRQVAEKLGVSKGMVQRSLEILDLPDDLLNALREGAHESKVLLLAKIEDPEARALYLKDLDTLTRKQIQTDLKVDEEKDKKRRVGSDTSAEDMRIADELQKSLGLKVKLSRSSHSSEAGKIAIDFYSDDDLQEIFRKLVS